jgi:ferredoxin
MKATVNQDLCIGCGLCAEMSPEVFEVNEDGKAVVKVGQVPAEAQEVCRDAATQCPTEAIDVEEE